MKKLRVWWIRNVPGKAKYYPVTSIKEAKSKLKRLANADLRNPNVSDNVGGLEEFEVASGEWYEYYDRLGRDIDEIMEGHK